MSLIYPCDGRYFISPGREYMVEFLSDRIKAVDSAAICSNPYIFFFILVDAECRLFTECVFKSGQCIRIYLHSRFFDVY